VSKPPTDREIVAFCQDALFGMEHVSGHQRNDERHTFTVDAEAFRRATLALNGQIPDGPTPDWCWSTRDQKWFRR
jgi:hypothetical protein